MASSYGIIHDYGEPQSNFDAELALQALEYKQTNYDANAIKMEQVMTQYGMQASQIKNPQAREYFYNKLNNVISSAQIDSNTDWGDNQITKGIVGHVNQALDENVIRHINYGRQIDNYTQTAKQYQEEGEGGYSDTNFQYGLQEAGYQDYVNGGVDAKLGNLNYTPYQNVQQTYTDMFDEHNSVKKGVTKKVPHPEIPGYFVEKTVKGIDENEIRANVINTLNPDQQKQLQINAWASMQGQDPSAAYQEYVEPKVQQYEDEIEELRLNYEGKTEAQKAIVDDTISKYQTSVEYLTSRQNNPQEMYSFIGKEQLVNNMASRYRPTVTNEEWSSDATALKNLEKQEKQINSSLMLDQNRNKIADVSSTSITTDTEEGQINLRDRAEEEFTRNRQELEGAYNRVYNNLSSQEKKNFDRGYKSYIEKNDLDDNASNKANFLVQKSNSGKGKYLRPSEVIKVKEINRTFKQQLKARAEGARNILTEKQNAVFDNEFISTLRNNPNIRITDENGNVVSAEKYLRGKNVENLSETQKRQVLKSVFSDMTLSQTKDFSPTSRDGVNATTNFNVNRLANLNNELDSDNLPMLVNPMDIIYSAYDEDRIEADFEGLKEDMQLPSQMTKQQFRENITPLVAQNIPNERLRNPISSVVASTAQEIPYLGQVIRGAREITESVVTNLGRSIGFRSAESNLIIGGEGTETRRDLETALANETFDRDRASFIDDSVEDDATLRNKLNYRDEFENDYTNYISSQSENFAQNKAITVESSGTREGEQVPAYEELISFGAAQGVQFERGKPITLIQNETGDGYIATQSDTRAVIEDGSEELTEERKAANIYERDLRGTNISNWIREDRNVRSMTVENTDAVFSDEITFADENTDEAYLGDINRTFFGGQRTQEQLRYLTNQGAKDMLVQNHSRLMEDPEYGQLFKGLIDRTIDNSHIFRLKLEPTDFGTFNLKIGYEDGEEFKVLKSMDTGATDITDTVGKLDVMQQQFFLDYLDRLLTNIENNGAESEAQQINTLTKLLS